ncbi:MAG: NAD-binding protein [Candidatus Omnitrophica bacterium]|nr:NAD-binding protein [Candidatus Omnitrophota bacterium]MDE2010209.1 NAD-binding protein [Candidatus Omnitrophota bacterium]MDE2215253.1 NAD-binding protein [Candidatus Omnitrophota bacterium]MDE2231703.1 NAD-binding protein [Candidatus Omnitrophota bacterium]
MSNEKKRSFQWEKIKSLWPHGLLAVCLCFIGLLNVLNGFHLSLSFLQKVQTLNGIAESLSAVGSTAQVILGFFLMVAGGGLWYRLASAWTLSVLLLLIMIGIDMVRAQWGISLALEVFMLCALLLAKHRFAHRTLMAHFVFSLSGILSVLAYAVFGSYLMGAGFNPPIRDLNTAAYFAVTTLSTVGFGDIVPVTTTTRWFVVSLLVVGLGVFATAIASSLGPRISEELNRFLDPKEKRMETKNHVILVGDGAIARNTAKELKERGINFVHIVAEKSGYESCGHDVIEGEATSDAVLRQAGIQQARMVIAAREDDGDNAFIALGAKDLNPKVRVLAVASSVRSIRRLKLAGADQVFSPAAVGSRLLANLIEGGQISPEFNDLLEGHPK